MFRTLDAPGATIALWWRRLRRLPGGRILFSTLIGWIVPYSGSIGATISELEPGYSRWTLRDRRKVRNHLNSVHAIAMANLGEVTCGTALLAGLPSGVRGIPRSLSVSYLKKARGTLTAECQCQPPSIDRETDYPVEARISNSAGEPVAVVTVLWRLSPAPGA